MVKVPAVVDLEQEGTEQRATPVDKPEKGPEESSPPSEPRSPKVPFQAEPFQFAPPGNLTRDDDAPLVDLALASVRDHDRVSASVSPDEELEALRAEVSRLRESVAEIGSASARVLRARSEGLVDDARARIRRHPFGAVGCALIVAYLFGRI
ncbi:hypothetical protein LVY75_35070 (plasmid) [Sinorhizobium sp. B11]